MSGDLSTSVGQPRTLFQAIDAPWPRNLREIGGRYDGFVTDGPFLYRSKSGQLFMLWSSFTNRGYAIGLSRSPSGSLFGPWEHDPQLLFPNDGGHPMLFCTFDGRLVLAFHQPNRSPAERARLWVVEDTGTTFRLVQRLA